MYHLYYCFPNFKFNQIKKGNLVYQINKSYSYQTENKTIDLICLSTRSPFQDLSVYETSVRVRQG